MNAALARPSPTPGHRQLLHFALGKAHDDMENYEAAMQNFEAGNRIRALGGRLGRRALVHYIDRMIAATPPGYRDRQPDPGVEDATPILIVGMPRSGSTLTEQILSSHPEIAAGGEREFWSMRYAAQPDIWGLTSTPDATRRLADDYVAALRTFGPDAKRVTDKMLANFIAARRHSPRVSQRDHRSTAGAIRSTRLYPFSPRTSRRPDTPRTGATWCSSTRQYQRLMAHWRKVLPPDRLVEVDYEALVSDPGPQARRLISACGLAWNDACLEPHRNTREGQHGKRLAGASAYLPHVGRAVAAL